MKPSRMIGLIIGMILVVIVALLAVRLVISIRQNTSTLHKEQQVVYAAWANTLEHYTNVFYPQSVDTIYLFGDTANVLLPKLTQVYYWPITQEYRADWDSMNQSLTGILEILMNGQLVMEIEPTDYALVYDGITPKEVVAGEQAHFQYEKFVQDSRSIADDMAAYYMASVEYQLAYEKYLDEVKAGNVNAVRPESPEGEPPQIDYYVSKPEMGFIANLPPGDYQMRLKLIDGRVVDGTEKQLKISATRREGIGYSIFSEDRWTRPEISADPQSVIYSKPANTLYFQPYSAFEVNAFNYSKLLSPQKPTTGENRWEWVMADPLIDVSMHVTGKSGFTKELSYESYLVKQQPGTRLGYQIIPFDPEENQEIKSTFGAFRLDLGAGLDEIKVQVVGQNSNELSSSERNIEVVKLVQPIPIYLISTLPMVFGLLVVSWQRAQKRRNSI